MSNSFGKNLKITSFGESHGEAMGVIVDGCPSGLYISQNYIKQVMSERMPAQSEFTTKRKEKDEVVVLSGIYKDKTLGTPIAMIIYNHDVKSKDYNNILDSFRPSHADYTWYKKYSHRDQRGGGRSSARETVARVAASSIAYKILESFNIKIYGFINQIYDKKINYHHLDYNYINQNPFYSPDKNIIDSWTSIIRENIKKGDSVGGIIEINIKNCPVGLGNPVFDKLNSRLAQAIFSIPAVKGVEFGAGFEIIKMKGSQANDNMLYENETVKFLTNHNGGVLGGISNGEDIVIKIAMKPTSSISLSQHTINTNMENTSINIKGRHDPCVAIRGVSVCKAMCALVIADFLMENNINY